MLTKDEIIEMARQAWISEKEAQLITEFDMAYISCTYLTDLVAFAKLVDAKATAKEREKFFTKHEAEELLDKTDFIWQNNVTVEMYRKVMVIAERESKV